MRDIEDEREHLARIQRLWNAAIAAKLRAAAGVKISAGHSQTAIDRRAFDKWFRRGGDQFQAECEAAGIDPDWLREEYTRHGPDVLVRRMRKHILGLSCRRAQR